MKTCDCVEKLFEVVKKDHDPEGWVDVKTRIKISTGETWSAFPPVYFHARDKNKDGKLVGKPKLKHFSTPFCPMCGVKQL